MAHTPRQLELKNRHVSAMHDVIEGKVSPQQAARNLYKKRHEDARLAAKRIPDFKSFAERSLPPEKDD